MRLTSSVSRWLHTTRARLTLLFGGTAVATGLAVGLLADELLTRQLTDLSGQSLMNSSQPIALALAQGNISSAVPRTMVAKKASANTAAAASNGRNREVFIGIPVRREGTRVGAGLAPHGASAICPAGPTKD